MRFHKVPMLLGLRVEYAKSHARARRWIEEVTLVKEEMRRVLSYFNWKMDWWLQKATSYRSINDEKSLAFIAYTNYQMSLLKDIGKHFEKFGPMNADWTTFFQLFVKSWKSLLGLQSNSLCLYGTYCNLHIHV